MNIIYVEATTTYSHANVINVSIWLATVIIFIVTGMFLAGNTEDIISCIGAIMAVLGAVFFIAGAIYFLYGTPGPNKYAVTLSENYSFEELQENYDILDQKGLLYIVKEKEED